VILGAPNLAWRDLDLRRVVEDRVGLPTAVDNDANVATLAEATCGAARGANHMVMLTIGTGIGGGLMLDGRLYRGANGVGAELGHMVVDPDGPRCPCGNNGCLEVMASGTAIGRTARDRAAKEDAGKVLELAGGDPSMVVGETVVRAALAGDAFATSVLNEVGTWLGIGMANYVNIFDPEVFVLGGGAALGARDLLLSPAVAAMEPLIVERERRPPVRIAFAELGDDSGVIGAAVLARELT
jgi:glucokinase